MCDATRGSQQHSCSTHTCKLELRRPLRSCPAKPAIGPRGDMRWREQVGFSAPVKRISTSALRPPSILRPHLLRNTVTTTRHSYTSEMAPVTFWAAPRQYINWAARHKPAILWSLVIGSFGPLIVVCNAWDRTPGGWNCNRMLSKVSYSLSSLPFANALATTTDSLFLSHTRVSANTSGYRTARK
jgi:hypothetical protein